MKKSQGFTLIELIAVITMLAVIALITIPAVNGAITKSKNRAYQTQKNAILEAAKEWNLENVGSDLGIKQVAYDVMFIMDISGSMQGTTRFLNTVSAMNDIMKLLLTSSDKNRVSLIAFSNGPTTILNMDHYTSSNTGGNFLLTNSTSTLTVANNVLNSLNQTIVKSITAGGLTNAQLAIKETAASYLEGLSSINKNIPVVMFLTDGLPEGYCYTDYINLSASDCSSSEVNRHYYSILTAQYYKNLLTQQSSQISKFYTVGLDLTSATSIAFLDPTTSKLSNYTALKTMLESSSNPIKPYNYADMSFTGANMTQEDILNIFKTALADAISDTGKVNIQTLVDAGYIDESSLIDPRTGEEMVGYIEITYNEIENKYLYEFKE